MLLLSQLFVREDTMNTKDVLVTGVSRGIGKAICQRLVKEGYFVYGTYNTGVEEAKALKEQLKSLEVFQANFEDRTQTLALIEKLKNIPFHGIVNNAGMIEFENFENFDLAVWDRTLEVNLNAPLLFALNLGVRMKSGGSIINIASTDGMVGSFSSMAYSATKAALINLTMSLGNNFGLRGIRVNALAPGWINTGMATPESYEATQITPLRRNGTPGEVADLVLYLLSDRASFINGSTIVIDGGYSNVDYIMLKEAQGRAGRKEG
jgi:NAD(P)-dependent dehydrogenase (short-subunit alcohol dehydrogenase family)